MSFSHLKDLIPKAVGKFQLQGELQAAMVINRASAMLKELFPEEVERHIRVKRFAKRVLWLAVPNAAVANRVQMKSHQFQVNLNQSLGEKLVQNIRTFQEIPPPLE